MSSGHVNERPVAGPGEVGRELASRTTKAAADLVGQVKPKLRGWIHAGVAPFVLAAAIVLVAL